MIPKTTEQYVAERNRALMGTLADFGLWVSLYTKGLPSSKLAVEISYHQLRTACVDLPMDARIQSKLWLVSRKYKSWDDGDVPCPMLQ
jgi:hypothetical protein